ncbi:hypothetical protein [Chishuiella sp.]|uniref:hypothetical protein n=1 Tax=Chishuiella sp. TaxID=1969467 RepID=UPI0028B17E86|nr:hypothetical protein [Chishuiella sp.]
MANKGYDDAKFYLDILIENGIINKSDEKVKQLFINWFKKNKEFDLQIENGDFAIEDGDFKFVPDFEKIDIIKFINWYNNEKDDFIKYLNENGILTIKQDSILRQNIKTENIVINNGKIKSLNQNSQNESKRIRWDIIRFLGFIIALLTFLFGDNIFS